MSSNSIEAWVSQRWQRDSRYYEAHLKRDLFGWVVVRNWGGIGQRTGRQMTLPVTDYHEGMAELQKISLTRGQRNYHLCQIKH